MSVMCLSDGSRWPATTAEYQKKKKRKCVSKMHRSGDMTTYRSKSLKTQATLIWHVALGWPLANFSMSHTSPETRVMGLSDGVHFTILFSLC